MSHSFADIILPFPLERSFTYAVPQELAEEIAIGIRVEVAFRNKIYTGLVWDLHDKAPTLSRIKPILSIPDSRPIVNALQMELWKWMSEYYMCSLGEVFNAAVPAFYKMGSESVIIPTSLEDWESISLTDREFALRDALMHQKEMTMSDIQQLFGIKTIQPVVKSLIEKKVISIKEEVRKGYKPKTIKYIRLSETYSDEEELQKLFESLERARKQQEVLMIFIQLSPSFEPVKKSTLLKKSSSTSNTLKSMIDKGIFIEEDAQESRIKSDNTISIDNNWELSDEQSAALNSLNKQFKDSNIVLLQGITGSGKTEIYIKLIQEQMDQGKQVLYLLPEIALTAQIITRLRSRLGDVIGVYHSKFNNNERIEIWEKVGNGSFSVVIGARSALLLPFNNLGLVIVDEEHDYSYKQQDPAPRYQARDTAIYLAHLAGVKTLLGSATPSVESFYNATSGKYGYVQLQERFSGVELPEIELVKLEKRKIKGAPDIHISDKLLEEIKETLLKGNQVILFQNRRGYSPYILCAECGWSPECVNCDVHLVYHKASNELRCHYCGFKHDALAECPSCSSTRLLIQGFGTEKIEDELSEHLPNARIARMDLDSVKSKSGHEKIISDFENGMIDVLVGTQMVTKGLDFDHVSLVGILSAEQLLNFPDFRASERAFQLMTQVSGRAGRKHSRGKVVIQVSNTKNPVVQYVVAHEQHPFYVDEIAQRMRFNYPPFVRLIAITFKHKKQELALTASYNYLKGLPKSNDFEVLGPVTPNIARVRNKYLVNLLIKVSHGKVSSTRRFVLDALRKLRESKQFVSVDVIIDADPV